jgi:methyl-accepting chemotaxis protein
MTGEEMERAIEFLLKSQAKVEAQIEETGRQVTEIGRQVTEMGRQVTETGRQLADYAETQSVFIQTVTRALEAQDQINASLRAADTRTDERLNKLIGLFEQHITVGH